MGIRVHKAMGYGLENVLFNGYECVDERINKDIFSNRELWAEKIDKPESFLQFIKDNKKKCMEILSKVNPIYDHLTEPTDDEGMFEKIYLGNLYYIIEQSKKPYSHLLICEGHEYNDQYKNEEEYLSPIVLIPIECPEFFRYDDPIDYEEIEGVAKNKVNVLHNSPGIFPYNIRYHIPGSPYFGKEGYPNAICASRYNQLIGIWDEGKLPPILKGERLEYYKKYYRPSIHPSVILFAYWIDIFVDFYKIIHELRPMIYTYWN